MKMPIILFAVAAIALAGCNKTISNRDIGAVVGTTAGALIGASVGKGGGRTGATIIGAVVGGLIGSKVGEHLDEKDRKLAEKTAQKSLEFGRSNKTRRWKNPDTGNRGRFTPRRAFTKRGVICREFTQRIYIDGYPHTAHGTACRDDNGRWTIVNRTEI